MDDSKDGIIWVQKVEDPSAFGVVQVDEQNHIKEFVEKPQSFVSDLAIIGIYYFKDGAYLRENLQYLIDNDIKDKGEYQITDALERMKEAGTKFVPGEVVEWLDCGNKNATVNTNQRILEFIKEEEGLIAPTSSCHNATIIPPCFIGENVSIENSVVGPHVSIGNGSKIQRSVISNSIIQENSTLSGLNIDNSMIGNESHLSEQTKSLSIGDYNEWGD